MANLKLYSAEDIARLTGLASRTVRKQAAAHERGQQIGPGRVWVFTEPDLMWFVHRDIQPRERGPNKPDAATTP